MENPSNCLCEVHVAPTLSNRGTISPWLSITCSDFHEDPKVLSRQLTFYRNQNISELWITNSSFPYLPSGCLASFQHITRLSLHNVTLSKMSQIGENTLRGVENSLKWFYLEDVSFTGDFDWSELRNMRALNIIHAFNSHLETSKNIEILENVPLHEFYIWGTSGLEYLGKSRAFSKCADLIEIGLRRIGLRYLQRDMLPIPANKLITIEICQNPISFLPVDLFQDMPQLRNVDLSGNQIVKYQPEMFSPILAQLKSLTLTLNHFFCENGSIWFANDPFDQNPYRYEGVNCYYDATREH